MKKIYFAGSIRGGREDSLLYLEIIKSIQALNHEVLTEHVGLKDLKAMGEIGKTEEWIYKRDMAWLEQCHGVVAEVTNPSLGVGYELAKAEIWGKPILCLYRPIPNRSLSAMIAGSPYIKLAVYNDVSETKEPIADFMASL